jgi:rod shape-determining protein MreC
VTRSKKINRYLLLLALLFVLAVLRGGDLPGEEVLPDLYRATVHRPLLAPAAAAASRADLDLVALQSELEVSQRRVRLLEEKLEKIHALQAYFGELAWEAQPEAVPAWVFAVDTDPYRRTFAIDRGERDGIAAGMPVVTGRALLGVVIRTHLRSAVVRRVDDPGFRLEVEIETGKGVLKGVARGDGDKGLDVRFVRRAAALRAGDAAFTSRYHPLVPPGLLVGHVESVDDLDQNGIHEVAVTPASALGRWAQVHVLRKRR